MMSATAPALHTAPTPAPRSGAQLLVSTLERLGVDVVQNLRSIEIDDDLISADRHVVRLPIAAIEVAFGLGTFNKATSGKWIVAVGDIQFVAIRARIFWLERCVQEDSAVGCGGAPKFDVKNVVAELSGRA